MRRVLFAFVVLMASVSGVGAQGPREQLVERYVQACRLARAGSLQPALEQFDALARENPAWIPAHRALALTALAAGGAVEERWRADFSARVRRLRRDVGASVGLAVLLRARGEKAQAHQLLLSSVMAGARSTLLVPLLVDTSADPNGLGSWFALRAGVLPIDPAFATMRARLLLDSGQIAQARRVIDEALEQSPDYAGLLALRAELLTAAGAEAAACEPAALASGLLLNVVAVPEIRIPRRLALTRSFIACDRLDEARTMLASVGPAVSPPGERDPVALVRVVRAELALARGELLEALTLLPAATD
ncbi:MAG: hypothetical protein JSV80_07340, partial [Acidobacteriota bacterium]